MYAEHDGDLVVFSSRPHEKRWWRNLVVPAPVMVVLRGRKVSGLGHAILDDDASIRKAWDAYAARFPAAAKSRKSGDEMVFVRIMCPSALESLHSRSRASEMQMTGGGGL
jgi:hypothetical protein